MADTSMLSAEDIKALAEEVHSEADAMRIRSERLARIYVVVGVLMLAYLTWSFRRIADFVEPTHLADTSGEIALGQARDLIGDIETSGKANAPELVRQAETAVIHSVPDFRLQLETQLRQGIGTVVKSALESSDRVMVEELTKVPDAHELVVSAQKNPDDAARLFAEVRARVAARPDVKASMAEAMAELNKLRDHLRKLKDNRALTPSERAERRLLQVVLAKVEPPKEPPVVIAMAKPTKKKHRR